MSLAAGTKLGPYDIVGALGAGGMGEVYRARETRLDRTIAIKVLPAHLSGSLELRQRFIINDVGGSSTPLNLVLNWTATLPAR